MTTHEGPGPTAPGEPPRSPRPLGAWRLHAALLALALVCAGALVALGSRAPEERLEPLFPISSFELTDQDGRPFGTEQLRGRVWIASFFFTSCTQACPSASAQLANLRARLAHHGDRVHVVSITVDPEVDTPERLRAYAARFGGTSRWTLLTGAPDDVHHTLERAFFQPPALRTPLDVAPGYDLLHGTGVLLVDRDGVCRGLFPTDGEGLDRLVAAIDRLLG